jgi:glyoxylase-like metal-dependent hydrolase (beta-lactamase superfamily II)
VAGEVQLYAQAFVGDPIANPSAVAPTRSEGIAARETVDEVAPGILRMQLPIQIPGLAHINTYALLDKNGAAIVDPGLPGPESWRVLKRRLTAAGIPIKHIHTVLITHSHPDHFGNAGLLAQKSGAKLMTHRAFRTWWSPEHQCSALDCEDPQHDHAETGDPRLPPRFVPGSALPWSPAAWSPGFKVNRKIPPALMRLGANRFVGKAMRAPTPTHRLRNNQPVTLAGREWFAMHTPGHTLDHLCLYDPEGKTFISGDHVLPTITPHIGGIGTGEDPMRRFFDSLRRAGALTDVTIALPAHGDVIHDLFTHHEGRLDRLREALATDGAATVEDMSHVLFRKERWGHMAESETYAHLEYLKTDGELIRSARDGTAIYELG